MSPSVSSPPQMFYQQPQRTDADMNNARQAEVERLARQKGRNSTLLVTPSASGADLLPAGPGAKGSATLFGQGASS